MIRIKKLLIIATFITTTLAVPPPNYVEQPRVPDKYPPKYEYNYFVANKDDQASQGHKEIRNGDNTSGNYYVNLPQGQSQATVSYIADDWGYHPVVRYSTQGAHSHASSHFALGQSAVEALHTLNHSNLNKNEVYVNQLPQQAVHPKSTVLLPVHNNYQQHSHPVYQKIPQINHQIPAQYQQQGPIYQTGGLIYNEPQPQFIFQQQHQPQIYLQPQYQQVSQPINEHPQPSGGVTKFITNTQHVVPDQDVNNINTNLNSLNNINDFNDPSNQNNFHNLNDGQEKPNNNLLQVPTDQNVASDNQKLAEFQTVTQEPERASQFLSPIIVENQNEDSTDPNKNGQHNGETVIFLQNIKNDPQNQNGDTVIFQQNKNAQQPHFEYYQQPQKQINIQILSEKDPNNGQFHKELVQPNKQINGHTNHNNNFQYLVEDDQFTGDSTPKPQQEAPSRQFLKKFNGKIKTIETSTTTSETLSSSTTSTFKVTAADENCCKDKQKSNCCNEGKQSKKDEKILEITQRPISNKFLAPVHAGIRISSDKSLDDCLDGHLNQKNVKIEIPRKKTVVEVQKSVNIKNYLVKEKQQPPQQKFPVFGDRIIVQQPQVHVQPIFVEKQQPPKVHIQPIFVEKQQPPKVQIQPIYIEKPPIIKHTKEQVFIKSDPIIKHVHYETIKEKIVPQFLEKIKYVSYPVEVEKIKEKLVPVHFHHVQPAPPPIIKHVKEQVFVDRPVPVDRIQPQVQVQPIYIEKQQPPIIKHTKEQVFIKSDPIIKHVHHETVREKIVNVPYEKIVEKEVPVHIHHTQPAQQIETIREVPVYIEKPKIIEKVVTQVQPVYLESEPIIKHVHHEKIVEKIVNVPFEKIVEKEKLVNVPVEVIKYVDRPYPVEGAPYGIPYPVHIPVQTPPQHHHHFLKPDFHVIAKTTTHKHKMFDLNSLFGKFMGQKQNEVKHIYVKPQHHLQQQYYTGLSDISGISAPASPNCDPFLNIGEHGYGQNIADFAQTTRLEPVNFGGNFEQQNLQFGHQFGQEFNQQFNHHQNFYGQNFDHASYAQAGAIDYDQLKSTSIQSGSWLNNEYGAPATSVHKDEYVGPTPFSQDYWAQKQGVKFRRNAENGRSLRIEYGGFLPPIVPSVEIDENGTPKQKE